MADWQIALFVIAACACYGAWFASHRDRCSHRRDGDASGSTHAPGVDR